LWVKDANQNKTSYEYDVLGRRTSTILPLGQRSTTTYDAVGNILSQTDFNRDTITYRYDELNRLLGKYFPDGIATTFTYTPTGQRQTVSDARGTTVYTYDERDRLLSFSQPDRKTISYTYDIVGNRTSVTTFSGTTRYTFDVLNNLDTVIAPNLGETNYKYDAVGNLIETTLPNSVVEIRQYDSLNQLVYLENRGNLGNVISSYRYTMDLVGNRKAVEENNGRNVYYTYDNLYRLTEEDLIDSINGNRSFSYTYDSVGNRLSKIDSIFGMTNYEYDFNDRLLKETTGNQVNKYTYDNNGNTLTHDSFGEQTVYDWSYENRLIEATIADTLGTKQMQYQYDADGIRVAEAVDGQQTKYLIDTNQSYAQVLEEYAANDVVGVYYVYGNDLISQNQIGTPTYYLVDGLGSTKVLTDASGKGACHICDE
jgi:YD repeat-containing protein